MACQKQVSREFQPGFRSLGPTESARHNPSAAKTMGSYLSEFIDRAALGMLKLDRGGVRDREIILKLSSRTPSLLQDRASLAERWMHYELFSTSGYYCQHQFYHTQAHRP